MSRLSARVAASVIVTTTLAAGAFAPAFADESPAPVTADDAITTEAQTSDISGVTFIDVLANDSSPSGDTLEICRIQGPERGLSVAEVSANGDFQITTPTSGVSSSGSGSPEEDATEQLVVLPWKNVSATYTFTYWACDTEHLTPATVTVKVKKVPEVVVRKADQPGRVRFTNPRSERVVVIYGGARAQEPAARVNLAPGSHQSRKVEYRAIRWYAFSARSGQPVGQGIVRGIRPVRSGGHSATATEHSYAKAQFTPRMLRAWRA